MVRTCICVLYREKVDFATYTNEHRAYFYAEEEAVKYAKTLVEKHKDDYVHQPKRLDCYGNMTMYWSGDNHEVWVDDYSMVEHHPDESKDYILYTPEPQVLRFSTETELNEFILKSQNQEYAQPCYVNLASSSIVRRVVCLLPTVLGGSACIFSTISAKSYVERVSNYPTISTVLFSIKKQSKL